MRTKICTSIEQSKKLLELGIDPSTADMLYQSLTGDMYPEVIRVTLSSKHWKILYPDTYIPCWSLDALLELMPPYLFEFERGIDLNIYRNISQGWHASYMPNNTIDMQKDKFKKITNGDSLIDAAFEMVVWLIEQGYLKVNK